MCYSNPLNILNERGVDIWQNPIFPFVQLELYSIKVHSQGEVMYKVFRLCIISFQVPNRGNKFIILFVLHEEWNPLNC